jgi:peptidyl-prolyl cis-trans isomerase SurA
MRTITATLFALIFGAFLQCASANTTNPGAVPLDHIVAVVNDDVILASELEQYLRSVIKQLQGQNTSMPEMPALIKQGLERLVVRSLQLQRAKSTGLQVDDATLNRSIQGIASKNRMNLEQFRSALLADNIDYESFREDIRQEIIISRLRSRDVINRITVSPQEIDDYLLREKDSSTDNKLVKFSHILIGLPDAATPEQIEEARAKGEKVIKLLAAGADFAQTAITYSDGQKAIDGGDYGFRPLSQVPPLFSKIIDQLKPNETSELFRSPYGFHILKLQQVKGQDKHIISQAKLRHILIRTSALVSDDDAKTRLEQLRTRIIGGDDFAVLARSNSEDTLSAKENGVLGWISSGDTVPAFEQVYTALDTGEISQPFKTNFGWHIVQVLERRQHDDTKQFRRTKAINDIKKQKTEEELQTWLRKLRDEAYVEYKLDRLTQ